MNAPALTLGDVLANPAHPGRDVHLFLPTSHNWSLSAPALVVSLDDTGETPEEVEHRTGLQYALPLSTVWEIVQNARLQTPHPVPADLLRAFHFYYERDAFMDFTTDAHWP